MKDSEYGAEKRSQVILGRLAETVGCSVQNFSNADLNRLGETSMLLTLWHELDDAEDRAKVLALVRSLIAKA